MKSYKLMFVYFEKIMKKVFFIFFIIIIGTKGERNCFVLLFLYAKKEEQNMKKTNFEKQVVSVNSYVEKTCKEIWKKELHMKEHYSQDPEKLASVKKYLSKYI